MAFCVTSSLGELENILAFSTQLKDLVCCELYVQRGLFSYS